MLELFSPAKVNLFLRVVSKRGDGYHNLSSLFQAVSLGDRLTMELDEEDSLVCTDPSLPTDKNNLALKAVDCFRRRTGKQLCFKIHLSKRIPSQAGLGGGSSNAATVLWGCNRLAGTKIPLPTLKEWAAEIGSDVPFFFSHGTAYCTGRGETVHHLPALPAKALWIVKPSFGISTPEVFKSLIIPQTHSESYIQRDLDEFLSGSLPSFNDLERPAFEINPDLKRIKQQLVDSGFHTVMMTGSGSSFICMGEGKVADDPGLASYHVQFVNRPLDKWYSS
jgi:4-diphosphocytidyl-2-C-methyl-D-erythritol kinase